MHLVNCVDKLTLGHIDRYRLLPYADYNQLMNSFVLRIIFCNGSHNSKVTLQIFLLHSTAICFTCNFTADMFYGLFYLLDAKYGIKVKTCSLCMSVWVYHLMSRIGDLSKFYWYLVKCFSTCTIEYEPELFPCITLLCKNTTVCIFHMGKINLLGVKQVKQVSEIVEILSDTYFDYLLSCNFYNFKQIY